MKLYCCEMCSRKSRPVIRDPSFPAESWQQMTQTHLTSGPGLERTDGERGEEVHKNKKSHKSYCKGFCVCAHAGPTSNKYSVLASDLCVNPRSKTFSTTTERSTGCFKTSLTGIHVKVWDMFMTTNPMQSTFHTKPTVTNNMCVCVKRYVFAIIPLESLRFLCF